MRISWQGKPVERLAENRDNSLFQHKNVDEGDQKLHGQYHHVIMQNIAFHI